MFNCLIEIRFVFRLEFFLKERVTFGCRILKHKNEIMILKIQRFHASCIWYILSVFPAGVEGINQDEVFLFLFYCFSSLSTTLFCICS